MVRLENEVVKPMNSSFNKRFFHDIYIKSNKFQQDILFEALHDFHPNIKLRHKKPGNKIENKTKKLYLQFLKFFKGISKNLQKLTSNFDDEIRRITAKFRKAG